MGRISDDKDFGRARSLLLGSAAAVGAMFGGAAWAQDATAAEEAEVEAELMLDEIIVTAAGTVTEGTDSWTADWSRTATGLVLTQKETPQSTSVVTYQFMKDQNLTNLTEVMENTTGITVQKYDSERTMFFSRGFQITNYMYDGVPTSLNTVWAWGDSETDMAMYDHVEVVRGATGLMVGAGEPSAAVNFIRKRPTEEFQGYLSSEIGTESLARIEGDVSGALNASGTVRGRLVGAAQTTEGTQDLWSQKRWLGYGIVEADVTDATTVALGANYQDNDPKGTTWAGLPAFDSTGSLIDWPWGSTTGTDWTTWQTQTTEAFGSVEHVFDNGWAGRLGLNYLHNSFDAQLLFISGRPDPVTGLGLSAFPGNYTGSRDQYTADASLNGDFEAWGRVHQFVVGAFGTQAKSTADYFDALSWAPVPDIWTWDGSYPEPEWGPLSNQDRDEVSQAAIYATGDFEVQDGLHVIAGARLNWWRGKQETWTSSYSYNYAGELTPYLGLTYDINPTYTLYASYTNIYQPVIAQDAEGNYLSPTQGHNYELGVKAGFFEEQLNASAAVFQTDQKDVAEYVDWDPVDNRSIYRQIDGTTTRGFELEVAGAVRPGLNVYGGYTYRYSEDDDGTEIYTNQPNSTLKLDATYELPGALADFTVGGGLRWQSRTDSVDIETADGFNVVQDPYTLFDLMARYQLNDTAALSLNVTNLTDVKYYQTTGFYDSVIYGEGRRVSLGITATF